MLSLALPTARFLRYMASVTYRAISARPIATNVIQRDPIPRCQSALRRLNTRQKRNVFLGQAWCVASTGLRSVTRQNDRVL